MANIKQEENHLTNIPFGLVVFLTQKVGFIRTHLQGFGRFELNLNVFLGQKGSWLATGQKIVQTHKEHIHTYFRSRAEPDYRI